MPDYNDKDQRGQAIPPRPRNYDEAARASLKEEARAQQANRDEGNAWDKRQEQRKADAARQLDKTKEAGPALRMYGQDRFVNTDEGRNPDRAQTRKELSPEQKAMVQKLSEARAADRAQQKQAYNDKQYAKLPEKPPPDRSR